LSRKGLGIGAPICSTPTPQEKLPMYFDSTQASMQQILNHDYLKQALEDRLGKNTLEAINMKQSKNKEILNKAATLRSKSVLKQIQNKDYE
jgi:hypothetical protein